jgi:L-Ala-D/L-Glu epimerase
MRIEQIDLIPVDLPFRHAFRHAASVRSTSASVFLKLVTDTGATGFGECLPREYVTGETQQSVCRTLESCIRGLLELSFSSFDEAVQFLRRCDGLPPPEWNVKDAGPAAWCAIDVALLDAAGKTFDVPIRELYPTKFPTSLRYSVALSAERGMKFYATLLKLKLFGHRTVKLKLDSPPDLEAVRIARSVLGRDSKLRVDANMAWTVAEAASAIQELGALGVSAVEQPVAEMNGLAALQAGCTLDLIVDESLSKKGSLREVVRLRAARIANIRISKCGGLIAAVNRATEARSAGLKIQIGCQVGETSLLSAANLVFVCAVGDVEYAQGCIGTWLLDRDPVSPELRFGYGGSAPAIPSGPGFGVTVDESLLRRCETVRYT